MPAEFLDTNILVYAVSRLAGDAAKASVARSLIRFADQAISLQVLQEFYVAATHPRKLGYTHTEALRCCQAWRRFTIIEPTLAVFDHAVALGERYQLGLWDAGILAAAHAAGCAVVYSEDFNPGQDYGGLRVENPFARIR